jgi:hypothetical protein
MLSEDAPIVDAVSCRAWFRIQSKVFFNDITWEEGHES